MARALRLMQKYLAAFVALATIVPLSGHASVIFPRPAELEPDIRFWTRVFTEIDTQKGFIHDARDLNVVYEITDVAPNLSKRNRSRQVRKRKDEFRGALRSLARGKRDGLTKTERIALSAWPEDVDNQTLRTAANHLRFQLGQSDKFQDGLIRSGLWRTYIVRSFAELGLPVEFAALPHVESSFNPNAYSHVGAAGLWQFTRSTGRLYLQVDHVVDERMDPFEATKAAARLLKRNYELIGSWPLALTAYNHGAVGMKRAARKYGTDDIAKVLRNYRSRTFGFASRNFYPAFLAALEVERNAEHHFGPLTLAAADTSVSTKVPDYVAVTTLERSLEIDRNTLREHNPALRSSVWNGTKYVPRGYNLRLPSTTTTVSVLTALTGIPANERFGHQRPDVSYKVRRGDTLSVIARRFRVKVSDLVALNGLRSRHRIRQGQLLRLPQSGSAHLASAIPLAAPVDGLYRVRSGDTLAKIARRFDLNTKQLVSANALTNQNQIFIGQLLNLGSADPDARPHEVPVETKATPTAVAMEMNLETSRIASPEPIEQVGAGMFGGALREWSAGDEHPVKARRLGLGSEYK